jgi:hypothetical protein
MHLLFVLLGAPLGLPDRIRQRPGCRLIGLDLPHRGQDPLAIELTGVGVCVQLHETVRLGEQVTRGRVVLLQQRHQLASLGAFRPLPKLLRR